MSDPLSELLARHAITDRLLDYGRGVDRIDHALICSVFHPDATADYGSMYSGSGYGFADFIDVVHPPMQTHTHHLSNIRVRVDGDRAGSETYVLVLARMAAPDGTLSDLVSRGRYVDRWERRDGEWRISHRQYLHSADDLRPVASAGFPTRGTRDASDPGYGVL